MGYRLIISHTHYRDVWCSIHVGPAADLSICAPLTIRYESLVAISLSPPLLIHCSRCFEGLPRKSLIIASALELTEQETAARNWNYDDELSVRECLALPF